MAKKPTAPIMDDILENSDEGGVPPVDLRKLQMKADLNNPIVLADLVYQITWHWADFHLSIEHPKFPMVSPPELIPPELISGTKQFEFVYPIHDYGSKLSTSKSDEMMKAGKSMYRLYMTIEKMIDIFIKRLKSTGANTNSEVEVSFHGHLLAQRKAFESIINLPYNVVVTNFDPGKWGERYLQTIKNITEKYGYPLEAPRQTYKRLKKT